MTEYRHGADRIAEFDSLFRGKRLGIITNATGLDSRMHPTYRILHERFNLCRIFAPEHGLFGAIQAGEKVGKDVEPVTGIEVQSLYGSAAAASYEGLDAVVYDIQDLGLRFYTYIYVMAKGMQMAAKAGIPFAVLDRQNPLGLSVTDGTVLDTRFASGVGKFGLASRYGLTCGELAGFLNETEHIGCNLQVVPCAGLDRRSDCIDIALPFVEPSPNIPTAASAFVYAGMVVLEGTNLSEGRGTTHPFELFGAPYIDGDKMTDYLRGLGFEGALLRSARFTPTFSKHAGTVCAGTEILLTDRHRFDAFRFGLCAVDYVRNTYPKEFSYVKWGEKYALDHILGTDAFRAPDYNTERFVTEQRKKAAEFARKTESYRIY